MTFFFDFIVDNQNNTINIKREFAADRPTVWDCYTKSEILDQWWMPMPWKSRTKRQRNLLSYQSGTNERN